VLPSGILINFPVAIIRPWRRKKTRKETITAARAEIGRRAG